jgi:adenylosuccinate synthase
VGEWDPEIVRQSVEWCGGAPTVRISLSHLDYLFPETATAGKRSDFPPEAQAWIKKLEDDVQAPVALVGTAPDNTLVWDEGLV